VNWTNGIKHRRNTKDVLILNPPAEGEIVYATDTEEWGTIRKNGEISWSYIFDDNTNTTPDSQNSSGLATYREIAQENQTVINVPDEIVMGEGTILVIDGIIQKSESYVIDTLNKTITFDSLNGGEDIWVLNGQPIIKEIGEVTLDLSGGITLPTWRGNISSDFIPYFRLYNNFIITLENDIKFKNPVVAQVGQSGVLSFKQSAAGYKNITFGSFYFASSGDATINQEPDSITMFDYFTESTGRILLTKHTNFVSVGE